MKEFVEKARQLYPESVRMQLDWILQKEEIKVRNMQPYINPQTWSNIKKISNHRGVKIK
jgi:hypothetical protein